MKNLTAAGKLRIAVIAILFVVFTIAGAVFYYGQLRSRSKAAPTGTPELLLVAASNPPMQADRSMKISVKLNPNGVATDLYAFDVEIKFDPSKVEPANGTDPAASVVLSPDILKQQITLVGTDKIRIVGTKAGAPFTPANQQIADIAFKMKTGADFPVTFTWGNSTLQVVNHVKIPLDLASNSTNSSSSSTSTATDGVSLSFISGKQTFGINEDVYLDVMVSSGKKDISSAGVAMTYDAALLTYVNTVVDTTIFNKSSNTTAPSAGNLLITAARSNGISGSLKLATVKFKAKAAGTANLAINKNGSTVKTEANENVLTAVSPYTVTISAASSSSSSSGTGETLQPGEQVTSQGDILYVNSTTFDQSPLRYEQIVQLEKGDYVLSASAIVYTLRGRGVLVAVSCAESDCGDGKKLNDIITKTPGFTDTATFVRKEVTFNISEKLDKKKLAIRVFVDDGSEADFDFISLTDIWGGEKLDNIHFDKTVKAASNRQYPQYWEGDTTGWMYANIDTQKGTDGSLYINSSSRK